MRPNHFYPRMPQGRGFQHYAQPMPPFQQFQPRQMPPGMMHQGFQMPQSQASKLGSGSFMETANRFLSTAQNFQPLIQQATPLIQQAAPMIKNLPALWKLYKGFQSAPNAGEDDVYTDESPRNLRPSWLEDSSSIEPPRHDRYDERPRRGDAQPSYRESDGRRRENRGPYPSVPRIYQPPYHFD